MSSLNMRNERNLSWRFLAGARNDRHWRAVSAVCLLVLMAVSQVGLAAPPATTRAEAKFIRFVGDSRKGGMLQTADVIYRNKDGVQVRLVAAVHIADPAYYAGLNRTFATCDAVLYEMVKPEGMEVPRAGESTSGISRLQRFLKDTLDLSFQLDEVDYSPKNFVHADLDAETFQRMQAERGESFATILLSALMKSLANPGAMESFEGEPADMLDLMTRADGTRQFKLILARRMGEIEREAMGMGALDGTVLLTERNKAAIKAVRAAIKGGKKNMAVFYGAAHLPDLADRLDLMGFEPVKTEWRDAWDVHIRADAASAFQMLMERARKVDGTTDKH